jgi:L-lactate dehydrogenase
MFYSSRISIIGAGTLGSTIAYSILCANIAQEILLVDMSQKIVHGQVLDLSEVNCTTAIRAGTFKEAGQSALVILTADAVDGHKTRQEWMIQSRHLLVGIASSMSPVHPDVKILVTGSPVDLYVQSLQSYLPHVNPNHIFGLGTTMATGRFKQWLSSLMPKPVTDAYCIGTREMPVVVWNHAKINAIPVSQLPLIMSQRPALEKVVTDHRTHLICERKGGAHFGISAYVTQLARDLFNQDSSISLQRVWVLSVHVPQYNCCLSWPVTLSAQGVDKIIDLPLASDEQAQLMQVVASNSYDFHSSVS